MDLFLIRHAIAEERGTQLDDADRALTRPGRVRFEAVVERLRRSGFQFDRVYHSPWRRAAETARMLEPITDGEWVVTDGLARSPTPAFFSTLRGERVACVGHEPWMGEALSMLTTGDVYRLPVRFKKGGVGWLRGQPQPGEMELRALIPPRVIAPAR